MSTLERPLGRGLHVIDLVLLSRDAAYTADLTELLGGRQVDISLRAVARDSQQLDSLLQQKRPQVLLVDGALPPAEQAAGLKLAESAGVPKTILLAPEISGAGQALSGAEVLFKYTLGTSLVESLRSLPAPVQRAGGPTAGLAAPVDQPLVVALYSQRGGAGVSTLAANLAYLYAAKGRRVALVDLARHGAQHVMLRQPHRGQGLSSLATFLSQEGPGHTERFNALLQQSLMSITTNGVGFHLLPAALPAKMDHVSAEHTTLILKQLLAAEFQVIVADLSGDLGDRTRGALAAASRVIVPVLPEIVSAWHALQGRDALSALVGSRDRLAYVINRHRPDAAFAAEEFTRLGGTPLLGTIPNEDRAVWGDLAAGRLTAARSGSPFALALRKVAHSIYPIFSPAELKQGGWPWSRH